MKICGIALIVLGLISLGRNTGTAIVVIAFGAYLVHRARQKKEEQKRHDD